MMLIVKENERGLVFKNGKFVKVVTAGKYRFWGDVQVEVLRIDQMIQSKLASLEVLLADRTLAESAEVIDVAD